MIHRHCSVCVVICGCLDVNVARFIAPFTRRSTGACDVIDHVISVIVAQSVAMADHTRPKKEQT